MQRPLPAIVVPLVVGVTIHLVCGLLFRGAGASGVKGALAPPALALFASPAALFSRNRARPQGAVCAAHRPQLMPSTRGATARGAGMPARKLATTTKMARSAKGGRGGKAAGSDAALLAELEAHTEILWPAKKRKDAPAKKGVAAKAAGGALKRHKEEGAGEAQPAPGEGVDAAPAEGKAKGGRSPKAGKKARAEPVQRGPPEGWRAIYDLVLELRKERDAPVDWAGSESLGLDRATGEVDKYHSMIALMLSSQTKDQVVAQAMGALKTMPGGLRPESVLRLSDEQLDGYIAKVGFHNNKVKFIKQASQLLLERHDGEVPATAEELIDLPGIGPKMAYILLKVAHNVIEGIGVDTHMHRIFNVLGWVESKQPEQTRKQLEGWLPREEWGEINVLFVGLGQMTQQPIERAKLMKRCIDSSRPVEALQLVLRLGADTNVGDPETGDTPLHHAARTGNAQVVEALLRPPFSARTTSVNRAGHSALKVAQDAGHGVVVRLLS